MMEPVKCPPPLDPGKKPAPQTRHPIFDRTKYAKNDSSFDPEDLTRRLETYLKEQTLNAQRRVRGAASKQCSYHHVPQVAAEDFTRTATPDAFSKDNHGKHHVHELSRRALKHHIQGRHADAVADAIGGLRQIQVLDEARAQRLTVSDRNQFQRTVDLEDAAQFDKERELYKTPQRTFKSVHRPRQQDMPNRHSMRIGDVDVEANPNNLNAAFPIRAKSRAVPTFTTNDRQNWAQSEKMADQPHRSVRDRVSPLLRRPESIWALRRTTAVGSQDLPTATLHERISSSGDVERKKSSFFGRFKREP